jgi:hypothetical protein
MTRRALFRRLHGWALALGHAESGEAIEDSVTDAVIKALELGRYDRRRSPDPMAWLAHDRAKPAQGLWSAEPCAAATRPGRPGRRVGRRPARVRGGIGGIRGPGRARGGGARTGAVAERDHDDAGGSCGC